DDVRRAITASGSPPTVIEVEGARAAVTPAFFEILGETRAVTRFGYKHEYNAAVAPDTIDKRLAALKNCPDLKSLKLCYAVCDDDAFAALGAFTALKSLELPFTNIEARHLPAIATLPKLESLGLSSCERLTTLTGLAEAKKLKSLALVSTPICDESAALLRDLPSLAHLGIHGTKISDAGLAELLESRSLQRITSSFMLESDAWVKDLSFSDRPFDLGVMRVSAGVREALLAKRPRLTISEMSPSTPRTLPPERDPRRSRR
ncbi:MAG TPA: hypothetical protein VGE52_14185, partial [Pirellulales bacterium]